MKNMLKKFYDYVDSIGIDKTQIYEEKGDGFTLVSFAEEGEANEIYNLALIFYEDESLEVYVRKPINDFDEFSVLKKLNELNAEYRSVTFFIDDNMLSLKSYCTTGGDIKVALKEMVQDMQLAQKEFKNI